MTARMMNAVSVACRQQLCTTRSLPAVASRFSSPASTSLRLAASRSLSLARSAPCACRSFSSDASSSSSSSSSAASSTTSSDSKPAEGDQKAEAASSSTETKTPEQELSELREQVKEKDAQIKELQDKWLRALADAQNVLTRSQNQVADAKKFAIQGFAKQLLEVMDVLEIAIKAANEQATKTEDPHFKNLLEGVTMTQKVLQKTFENNGVIKFEPLGEKFDPFFHDGILQYDDPEKTPGSVGLVLKSGYKLHERCLRAAQVGTVKKPDANAAAEKKEE